MKWGVEAGFKNEKRDESSRSSERSSYFSDASSFNEAKSKAAAYRSTACSSGSSTSQSEQGAATLVTFIEPAVSGCAPTPYACNACPHIPQLRGWLSGWAHAGCSRAACVQRMALQPRSPAGACTQVYQAYITCLSLYKYGVQVTQTSGFASSSLALDVKFVPNLPGAKASFTGIRIVPANSAQCSVIGNDLPPNASQTFQFDLMPFSV
jgi:hypothetical protein